MEHQSEYIEISGQAPAAPAPAGDQTERQLRRLRYLIENTPAIIYSSVPTGDFKMTYVSSNARRILGYDPRIIVRIRISGLSIFIRTMCRKFSPVSPCCFLKANGRTNTGLKIAAGNTSGCMTPCV
jgi:PAS domain-containing protein